MHTEICPLQKSQKICANFFFCRFDSGLISTNGRDQNFWKVLKTMNWNFWNSSYVSQPLPCILGRQKKDQTKKLLKLNASISRIFSNSFFAKVLLDSYLFFHKKNTLVFQKRSILILKLEDFRWHFIVLRIPPFLKNKTIETSDPKIWKQRFCHCHYLRVSWTARLPSIAVLSAITFTIAYSVALPSCWA